MSKRQFTPIEVLESRIAPAVIFLSGTELAVKSANGDNVNDEASAAAVGADIAVLLKKGDTLVLDTNGNQKLDEGEIVYLKVSKGAAMVFATDLDSSTSFQANEITGLAVGNGFKGAINGDVNGTIATVLDSEGKVTPEIVQHASIAGLTVSGRITEDIRVGKNLSNVKIGAAATGAEMGVQNVLIGTAAADGSFSFNGGTNSLTTVWTPEEGASGGNINNVTIYKGVLRLESGTGAASATGKGGNGGNINKLKLIDAVTGYRIMAGNGGDSTAPKGVGGNGGTVSNLTLSFSSDTTNPSQGSGGLVLAGFGGNGNSGGNGGDVRKLTMDFQMEALHWYFVIAGNGGNGSQGDQNGNGGNGGSVVDAHAKSEGLNDFVGFYGGHGGEAGVEGNGKGGNGGHVSGVTYAALGGDWAPYVYAGNGGKGAGTGAGGAGGDVKKVGLDTGETTYSGYVGSGSGGDSDAGKGGHGGDVKAVRFDASASQGVWIFSGSGGTGASRGGNSGSISGATINAVGLLSSGASIFTGNGGDGDDRGGNSGSITGSTITIAGATDSVEIFTGNGGAATAGSGGASGKLTKVTIKNSSGDTKDLALYTGNGGEGLSVGGNAGTITNAKVESASSTFGDVAITGGAGGSGSTGGKGASLKAVNVNAPTGSEQSVSLAAGRGGAGVGEGGIGGDAGSISKVNLNVTDSLVFINAGNYAGIAGGDGGTGARSAGGKGGSVSGIKGEVRSLLVAAPNGGSADGAGGNGGSITGINLKNVSGIVQLIRAGDGGHGATGGKGGSISKIVVPADIGDFESPFEIRLDGQPSMGGLVAGQAGVSNEVIDATKNGSISNVKASRIAAILAGAPDSSKLTAANAVARITKLKGVSAIGADVDGNDAFDFTDNDVEGFNFGDGDVVLDGLVIVQGKFKSSVAPLKLIEVS